MRILLLKEISELAGDLREEGKFRPNVRRVRCRQMACSGFARIVRNNHAQQARILAYLGYARGAWLGSVREPRKGAGGNAGSFSILRELIAKGRFDRIKVW